MITSSSILEIDAQYVKGIDPKQGYVKVELSMTEKQMLEVIEAISCQVSRSTFEQMIARVEESA